ncbi:hypothetical protein F4819DRAFT_115568 [Hypoxylon fuscum]|nr:hypothetical protein F4819DRAFT_115568 [Hypoxylon fuscum]
MQRRILTKPSVGATNCLPDWALGIEDPRKTRDFSSLVRVTKPSTHSLIVSERLDRKVTVAKRKATSLSSGVVTKSATERDADKTYEQYRRYAWLLAKAYGEVLWQFLEWANLVALAEVCLTLLEAVVHVFVTCITTHENIEALRTSWRFVVLLPRRLAHTTGQELRKAAPAIVETLALVAQISFWALWVYCIFHNPPPQLDLDEIPLPPQAAPLSWENQERASEYIRDTASNMKPMWRHKIGGEVVLTGYWMPG